MLLSKDARHMAVEFPSIYSRLEEMCNTKERMQDLDFVVVRLEEKISKKLKAVIETITQSTMEIGGKNSLLSKELIWVDITSKSLNEGCVFLYSELRSFAIDGNTLLCTLCIISLHTTYSTSICPEKGLMLETSALQLS